MASNENIIQTCKTCIYNENESEVNPNFPGISTVDNNYNHSNRYHQNLSNSSYEEAFTKGQLQRGLSAISNDDGPKSAPIQHLNSLANTNNQIPGMSVFNVNSSSSHGHHLSTSLMHNYPNVPGFSNINLNSDSSDIQCMQPGVSICKLTNSIQQVEETHKPIALLPGMSIMNTKEGPRSASIQSFNSSNNNPLPGASLLNVSDPKNTSSSMLINNDGIEESYRPKPLLPGMSVLPSNDHHDNKFQDSSDNKEQQKICKSADKEDKLLKPENDNRRKLCYIF